MQSQPHVKTAASKGKFYAKLLILIGTVLSIFAVTSAFADGGGAAQTVDLGSIATNVDSTIGSAAKIMQDIGLIAGIVMVLMGLMKFKQHSNNPQQIPASQALIPLLIGAALIMYPSLISTTAKMIMGKSASVTKLGGKELNGLIGGSAGS